MRSIRWLILIVLSVFAGFVYAAPQTDDGIPPCPSSAPLCQLPTTWTVAQLEAQLGDVLPMTKAFVSLEDRLTFVYRAEEGIENVTAIYHDGQLQELQMESVEDSDWWVLDMKIQIPPGSEYTVTLGLGRYGPGRKFIQYPLVRWSRTCAGIGETFACEATSDTVTPTDNDLPVCPSPAAMCRISQPWTLNQLRQAVGALEPGQGNFIDQHNPLTFVYRAGEPGLTWVSALFSVGTMDEIVMQPVEASDWWVLTIKLQFERADSALMTLGIAEHGQSRSSFRSRVAVWRGKNAPPAPPTNRLLNGTQLQIPFMSVFLNETRDVYVYLPPQYDAQTVYPVMYMTDGESLPNDARLVDYLITTGAIPPLVMIGTASAGEATRRGYEYVPGRHPASFEKHERFFTQEIRNWAQHMFNVSMEREDSILFGISNGGLFAVSMSVRHPELYGTILPFSAGASAGHEAISITRSQLQLPLNVYAVGGTLEPIFHETTRKFVRAYNAAGAYAEFSEQVAGHDSAMWEVELVNALKWLYR